MMEETDFVALYAMKARTSKPHKQNTITLTQIARAFITAHSFDRSERAHSTPPRPTAREQPHMDNHQMFLIPA